MATSAKAASSEFRRLDGREIAARLTGMTFTDEAHWSYHFEPRGRLTAVVLGRPREGAWHVEGGQLCATRGPGSAECHEVWMSGVALELRRDGAPPEQGILVRSK